LLILAFKVGTCVMALLVLARPEFSVQLDQNLGTL
jgi:hypothetical protein